MSDIGTLRAKYIETLYEQGAFRVRAEPFHLHHGGDSHIFLDHSIFLSRFENLDLLVSLYALLMPADANGGALAAVDSVMSPVICGLLAARTRKDVVVVKEKKLEHGLESRVYGDAAGEIILVDDVSSTGTILVNAARALREKGGSVRHALLSACRDTRAIEALKDADIQAVYIATYEDIARTLWESFSSDERALVRKEVQDKGYAWQLPA